MASGLIFQFGENPIINTLQMSPDSSITLLKQHDCSRPKCDFLQKEH